MTQQVEILPVTPEISLDAIPNLFLPDEPEETAAVDASPEPAPAAPVAAAPVETPEEARVAQRIATAKKTELRASKERAAAAQERAQLDEYKAKIEKIKTNPIAALNEIGLDPDEFLKRVISDGKPSPESELADIKASILAQKEENTRLKAERDQYFQTQTIEKAKDAFVSMVESRHADFEHLLSEYTPEEIRDYGFEIARREGASFKEENGEDITDEYIAVRLNEFAKQRSEKRSAWHQRVKGAPPASQAPVELAKVASPAVSRANAPRTLTNGQASQKLSAPITKRTQEEVDAECIRILEAGLRDD